MEREYYKDYDDFALEKTDENLVGRGINESQPLDYLGRVQFNTSHERLQQCMYDILATPEGTRFMNPGYGSKLYRLFEEPNDFIAEDMAELFAKEAIEQWEPRVVITNIVAQVDEEDKKIMNIKIDYKMKDINDAASFVYSFNREVPEMEG